MGINVYLGKQIAEKQRATSFINAGATDFNVEENITVLESEVFNDLTAKGDSVVGKIEVGGSIPIELSKKILRELMGGISYNTDNSEDYKMSTEKPTFYTIALVDTETEEKWEYLDCVIAKLDINIAIGGYVKGTIDIIGKTYEISTDTIRTAISRGESLRCLYAKISLDESDISENIEGVDISVDNGIEAKGSLNSLYNTKIRRTKQMETKINIQKNEYERENFSAMKSKMINGEAVKVTIKLGDSENDDLIIIAAPKLFINSNKRGDYKGAGSHNLELQASVNNSEKSHLKITFKED